MITLLGKRTLVALVSLVYCLCTVRSSWLPQKQGIPGFSRTRVKGKWAVTFPKLFCSSEKRSALTGINLLHLE